MASTNDQTQLVGIFKDVWGNNVPELFKFEAPLLNMVGFEARNAVGGKFHEPIELQMEHGFVHAAAASTPTLPTAIAGYVGDAQVTGIQMYARSLVSYEAIMRSQTDKQAVRQATASVVRRLGRSGTKRLEIQMLHGQRGLGTVSSLAAETGSYTTVITLTDASWAAGIWAGMEGATLDFYSSAGGTWRNSASAARVQCTISAVSVANKTITITYGTARASWDSTFAANDVIFFETGTTTTELASLSVVANNTGTLHNLSASTYALWGGNTYNAAGVLTMAKLLEAVSVASSFGAAGEELVCVISPKAYEVLNSDQAALRAYDVSYKKASAEAGSARLTFVGQTGPITVLPHAFQKDGQGNIFMPSEARRIGASDLDFVTRGAGGEKLILESANTTSSEMRIQSHQNLFVECPRHCVEITGITY